MSALFIWIFVLCCGRFWFICVCFCLHNFKKGKKKSPVRERRFIAATTRPVSWTFHWFECNRVPKYYKRNKPLWDVLLQKTKSLPIHVLNCPIIRTERRRPGLTELACPDERAVLLICMVFDVQHGDEWWAVKESCYYSKRRTAERNRIITIWTSIS